MKNLLPHQERVVAENKELTDKIEKLTVFIASEKIKNLPEDEQKRLKRQIEAMREYSGILDERIFAF